ncbi:TraM recognition domain-containing protein [bacterium]|nr:TraM recognition domain-containing protein [bacterium]
MSSRHGATLSLPQLCFLAALSGWAASFFEDGLYLVCKGFALFCVFCLLMRLPDVARILLARFLALRPGTGKGSARWAAEADHRRYRQYDTNGLFLGASASSGKPLFFKGETHGLTLSPAGGGKTVNFVIPALLHAGDTSIITTDLKGTLACITKNTREKRYGQRVLCLNPGRAYEDRLGPPVRYNPLQILIDDWQEGRHADLIADTQAIALQLHAEPPQSGENTFFRNGSRKLIVVVTIYTVTHEKNPTLSRVLHYLRDQSSLKEALYVAAASPILNGDFADMAHDLLPKMEAENTNQWESFREGAIQALDVFASSGWLAESTSACDFRLSDLKREKATVYLIADPARMKVYAPWLGLIGWCALTELTRCRNNREVLFLLDEAANFRIEGLSNALTTLREYGCRVWFVLQELEEYAKLYGRESLETLLSQCECKQIFGIRSLKTAELVSKMLGNSTVKSDSFALGKAFTDPAMRSVGEAARPLLTPDEALRFGDSIVLIKDQPPIHALKVGYHEIDPFQQWADTNPMFGKPFTGKIRIRLRYPKRP